MSIIDSLKRLFDPIEHRQEAEEQRRKREAARPDDGGDGPPPRQPEPRVCRVCAYEGIGEFCPRCLAGTMKRR